MLVRGPVLQLLSDPRILVLQGEEYVNQALQYLPVSAAVPVVSGIRIAATAILAYLFFGEHLTVNQFFASSLITAGIFMMLRA